MSVPFKGCHEVSRRKVGISATYPARILSGQTTVMCVVVQNRVERKLYMVCEDRWRKEKSHRKPRTVDREPSDHFSPFPPYITACILRPLWRTTAGAIMTILSSPVQYVASTPPVTRAFAAATVVLSLLYYWISWSSGDSYAAPYLTLVPGTSIFYPWSFLTAGLVETSLIEVCDLLDFTVIHHSTLAAAGCDNPVYPPFTTLL